MTCTLICACHFIFVSLPSIARNDKAINVMGKRGFMRPTSELPEGEYRFNCTSYMESYDGGNSFDESIKRVVININLNKRYIRIMDLMTNEWMKLRIEFNGISDGAAVLSFGVRRLRSSKTFGDASHVFVLKDAKMIVIKFSGRIFQCAYNYS